MTFHASITHIAPYLLFTIGKIINSTPLVPSKSRNIEKKKKTIPANPPQAASPAAPKKQKRKLPQRPETDKSSHQIPKSPLSPPPFVPNASPFLVPRRDLFESTLLPHNPEAHQVQFSALAHVHARLSRKDRIPTNPAHPLLLASIAQVSASRAHPLQG